ncbi:MAG: PadR family transcriptional regulator [Candidatus Thorarchaeota archaeon]|nr:PadR family transcriptional regulator [Candidatus Thorarchaeota archaeon]
MKVPRSDIMRKILLTIDRHPSSIYDIQYSISDIADPGRTRLPKLLKAMEEDELVVSALQPGPLGPYRRMYELGPRAQDYLNESLRDAIETILHFYCIYRHENSGTLCKLRKEPKINRPNGCILFAAFPNMTVEDLHEIRDVIASNESPLIAIIGSGDILCKTGIDYLHMGDDINSIDTQSGSVSEIRLRGVPNPNELPSAISECKRSLAINGILRITVPFVFFDEPRSPMLDNFISKVTMDLFPELGIVEGKLLQGIIEENFSKNGLYETNLGQVVFWGIKS